MKELSFEKALEELEAIVSKLESGEQSLDDSLVLFEKGIQLAKYLRTELEKAEKKIEILLKDEEGQVKTEPFDMGDEDEEAGKKSKKTGSGENGDLPF